MKYTLCILLLVIGTIYKNTLQASLTQDLQRLVISLDNLENELAKPPPVPPRKYETEYELEEVPGFIVPLPKREIPKSAKPLTRTTSAYFQKRPLSQSTEIPARPKQKPESLLQAPYPEGISVAKKQPEKKPSIARTTSVYIQKKPATLEAATKARLERTKSQKNIKSKPSLLALPIKVENFSDASVKLRGFANQTNTLELAANKKEAANKLLDVIKKTDITVKSEKDKQLLYQIIKGILSIDPLLIQAGLDILRTEKIPTMPLYNLIIFLYEKRIDYLDFEFSKIQQADYKLPKGIRDDIDEALAYPIEVSGEVQDAEIKANLANDQESRNFYNNINDQWLRLLQLLKGLSREQKNALLEEGIDIDEYLETIEENKLRAYCVYDPKLQTKECNPYKSFYEELSEMAQIARNFKNNQELYNNNRTRRTFAIQNIINKLKAFASYAQNPQICQICLNEDAKKANEEFTKRNFQEIVNFFKERLSEDPSNKKYLEILQTIESIKEEEAKRRESVRKLGVGFQYQ